MAKKKLQHGPIETVELFLAKVDNLPHNIFVGIDPGLATGAMGFLCAGHIAVIDVPVLKVEVTTTRKGKRVKRVRTEFDYTNIIELFRRLHTYRGRLRLALERTASMPGDTGMTGHAMGRAYELWPLFLASKNIRVEQIAPADWKRQMGLCNKKKDASRIKALSFWPRADITRKKDHNRAEALLLAEALRRRHGSEGD